MLEALKSFNTLTLTDRTGKKATVYFSKQAGSNVLEGCEMPPAGPEGTFDVRFASGRLAEHLGTGVSVPLSVQGGQYPLTVSWKVTDGSLYRLGKEKLTSGEGSVRIEKAAGEGQMELAEASGTQIPTVYSLSENYPNPFNPSTKFEVGVPKTSSVDVTVYNILGQPVRTLALGEMGAGFHTIEWNGLSNDNSQVGSGIYFVRMVGEKFNAVRKIMMMK